MWCAAAAAAAMGVAAAAAPELATILTAAAAAACGTDSRCGAQGAWAHRYSGDSPYSTGMWRWCGGCVGMGGGQMRTLGTHQAHTRHTPGTHQAHTRQAHIMHMPCTCHAHTDPAQTTDDMLMAHVF